MTKRICVIAAHPDDEVLGCGGAIANHTAQGDEVNVIIVAEGITSRADAGCTEQALIDLHKAAEAANQVLGVKSVDFIGLPDNNLDSLPRLQITQALEARLAQIQPDVIYTHSAQDLNVDHRRVNEAVVTACRPMPGTSLARLLFFEVPSSSEWAVPAAGAARHPDYFIDISKTLALKLESLNCYAGEMRPWPHPRSIDGVMHLAKWRGATIGVEAAEAFVVGRIIEYYSGDLQ